jgi:DNA mismatch repair protein MutL
LNRIHPLPEKVVNQIAAGEVVERPASVVKELVENALDAGAHRVDVEFTEGGTGRIKVADDGTGMGPEDAVLSVARHATSKIRDVTDLSRLVSFGFRGEALASIASVSRFELLTSTGGSVPGVRVVVKGGGAPEVQEAARPRGTTVTVSGLFHNTPARLKFMKKPATESDRALQVVLTYALAYPEVAFSMTVDGREAFRASPGDLRSRLPEVMGKEVGKRMVLVERHEGPISLRGALSLPGLDRPTREGLFFFVNRRWVMNPSLGHALLTGYHTLLPSRRYPSAVLFLDVPPDLVDVNVHPTKREVKFRNDREVYDAVVRTVRQAMTKEAETALPPPAKTGAPEPAPDFPSNPAPEWAFRVREALRPPGPYEAARSVTSGVHAPHPFSGSATAPGSQARTLDPGMEVRNFVQMFNTFIVFQSDQELFIADQHTVHERLNYEKLMRGLKERSQEVQPLLVPATVELEPRAAEAVRRRLDLVMEMGMEVEPFGGNTFRVRSVPADLSGRDLVRIFRDLAEDLSAEEVSGTGEDRLDRVRERIATFLACRSSVMAGDRLNEEQMRGLVDRMRNAHLPFTCPHGRPTLISIPLSDLYRKFERH